MATKKGIVEKAIGKVSSLFEEPKRPRSKKAASKKAASKKAPAKKAGRKMDAKLVSTMELYEIQYLARKHGVTQKAVKDTVTKVGHSRAKVERELKAGKLS